MSRPTIITISGKPGSGKSSTADKVAELLKYDRFSSGDTVRKILKKSGLTLAEYNEKARSDHELDEKVDEALRNLRTQNDTVIDSRLGFYWIPESFKVYLDLDMDVATARIFKDTVSNQMRQGEGVPSDSLGSVTKRVRERMQEERNRFRELYNIDPYNTSHYDLVVDTSRHSPQTVALAVFDHYQQWLVSETWHQVVSKVPMGYSFKNEY